MRQPGGRKSGNIEPVVRAGLCTGCGTCVGLCSRNAIVMGMDQAKGVYVPQLDRRKCSECGICFDVCPGHSVDIPRLNSNIFGKEPDDAVMGNYRSCYVGYAADNDIRYNSASGGLVTALLVHALEEGIIDGALVTRMKRDKPLEPHPFIARTKEEIIEASKSKYCPVPANIALEEIVKEDGRYAVVGLPCHIHGTRKAELSSGTLKRRIVLHIGLLCAHCDSFVETEFILNRHGIRTDQVIGLDYRGHGWPGAMQVRLRGGSSQLIRFEDYINLHALHFFTPQRCHSCVDHIAGLGDLTFMDAWLPEVLSQDKVGTSIVISRTPTAETLCNSAKSKRVVELLTTDAETVLRSQGREALAQRDVRANFLFLRMAGVATPEYGVTFPRSGFRNYMRAGLMHFNAWTSSKSGLRWSLGSLLRLQGCLLRR